ncbi:MAG: potassium channel protein [Thermacetogeniaceae bacterium]
MKLSEIKIHRWMRLLAGVVLVVIIGVMGIRYFEGYSFLNALWFIIESLTTTGYGDFVPVTASGKIFMMFMLLVGISLVLYVVGEGVAMIIEGRLSDLLGRRSMERKVAKLENHILICGAGRVGSEVIHNLAYDQVPFVVIENDQIIIEELKGRDLLIVEGDATDDEVLLEAGVLRARGLIASLPSDADNVFITLTAKELNPNIIVVARANRRDSESKLLRAGANRVVAPELLGGRRMAVSILRPATVEFVDTIMHRRGNDIEIEEITVADTSSLCNQTLGQAVIKDRTGAMVIAVMRDGEISGVPNDNDLIKARDVLICIGRRDQLGSLENLALKSG